MKISRSYIKALPRIIRDSPKETSEKNDGLSVSKYSLDLLCTSICPLIMIMMSYCYGTKKDSKTLYKKVEKKNELEEELEDESEDLSKQKLQTALDNQGRDINQFAKHHMCLRPLNIPFHLFSESYFWLEACIALLHKECPGDKYKWDELREDM